MSWPGPRRIPGCARSPPGRRATRGPSARPAGQAAPGRGPVILGGNGRGWRPVPSPAPSGALLSLGAGDRAGERPGRRRLRHGPEPVGRQDPAGPRALDRQRVAAGAAAGRRRRAAHRGVRDLRQQRVGRCRRADPPHPQAGGPRRLPTLVTGPARAAGPSSSRRASCRRARLPSGARPGARRLRRWRKRHP